MREINQDRSSADLRIDRDDEGVEATRIERRSLPDPQFPRADRLYHADVTASQWNRMNLMFR